MTDDRWRIVLDLFDENERRIIALKPMPPVARAKFWRESAHGTLGHLTACQAAWLPLLRMIRDGEKKGAVAIRPDPLYTRLGFHDANWDEILKRFKKERKEWRLVLNEVDQNKELQTPTRILTAQTLTKRMVDHERRHLDDLARTLKKRDEIA